MAWLSTPFRYCPLPPKEEYLGTKHAIYILTNIKSPTKVALCFPTLCKILRTKKIGKGGGESECSQIVAKTPSQGRVAEGPPSKHFFSHSGCCTQSHPPLELQDLTPVAYASRRPGDGRGVGRKAFCMEGPYDPPLGGRQRRLPPSPEPLRTPGCRASLGPEAPLPPGLPLPLPPRDESARPRTPSAAGNPAALAGPGRGGARAPEDPERAGPESKAPDPGRGRGRENSGRPGIPNPGEGGARARSRPGPKREGGAGAPGRRGRGRSGSKRGGGEAGVPEPPKVTRKWDPLPSSPLSIGSGRGMTATTMASSSSSPSSHLSVTSKQSSAAPSAFRAMVRPGGMAVTGRRRTGAPPPPRAAPAPPLAGRT